MKRFEEVAQELVTEWLRTVQHKVGDLTEDNIDHAVDDTFPASDPIAVGSYQERVKALKSLDVVVAPDSISFKVPVGLLLSASKNLPREPLADRSIECATLGDKPLTLHVQVVRANPDALVDTQSEMATVADAAARG